MRGQPSEQHLPRVSVCDGDTDRNGAAVQGAGDTGGPVASDARPLEPEREPQEDSAPESDVLDALSQVLALEKQITELEMQQAHVEQEVSALLSRADLVKESLEAEHTCAQHVISQAAISSQRSAEFAGRQEHAKAEHQALCSQLQLDVCSLLAEGGCTMPAGGDCRTTAEAELHDGRAVVRTLEVEAHEARLERERCQARLADTRAQRTHLAESHEQFLRQSRGARHAVQAQSTALSRLQADELRNRTRSDRRRRQCAGQLVQCRSELADAASRADVTAEQLRKVRQQHGRQLKALRAETGDLQAEVDAHLQFVEESEAELSALHSERSQLEGSHERHARQELLLQEHAASLRADSERLECQTRDQRAEDSAVREALRGAEARHAAQLGEGSALEESAAALRQRAEFAEATSGELSEELRKLRSRLEGCSAEAARLQLAMDEVADARAGRSQALQEQAQLQDGSKQMQQVHDRHIADMHEALRRALRVKASHDELLEAFPSWSAKGREALLGTTEQSVGRVGKKVEALLAHLESSGHGPRRAASAEGQSTSGQRGQPPLQHRLQLETETGMAAALAAQRRKVVIEQQRCLDESRKRTDDMQRLRRERRQFEDEVAQRVHAWSWAHSSAEAELDGLHAQMRVLHEDNPEGSEAVLAEFSDLLQEQAIDRDTLQRQVLDLRSVMDPAGHGGDREKDEPGDELPPAAVLVQQLSERELEVEALRKEEEGLQQALVKLKAVVLALRAPSGGPLSAAALWQGSGRQGGKSQPSPVARARGTRSSGGGQGSPPPSQGKDASTPATPRAHPSRHDGIGTPDQDMHERSTSEVERTPFGVSSPFSSPSWQHRAEEPAARPGSGPPANLPTSTSVGALRLGSEGSFSPRTLSTSESTPS